MTRWYRAYEGTVTDAKLGECALVAGVSRSVAIAAWHCILESAASVNECGRFDTTARRVAVILGEPVLYIEGVFAAFVELGMIADNTLPAWSKRQYESDNSTERSRKSRERARAVAPNKCNGDATLQQQHATPPDTDTDTEDIRLDGASDVPEKSAVKVDQFALLEKQLREAAGWEREPHPNLAVIGPVAAVLTMGVDLDQDLLPACRTHGPRLTSRTSWKYILQAAISNRDNRLAALKDASKPSLPSTGYTHAPRSKPNSIADSFAAFDAAIADRERELAARENSAGIGDEGLRLVS